MVSRSNGCRVGATACGLLFLAAACGDSDPSAPEVIDLAGTYDYEFSVSNASGQLICDGEGVVTMSQTAEEFSGTYEGWAR